MGGGWETRRRRGPGHDWILIKLGARGAPAVVEVDTNHFKGNFPDRCALEAIDAPAGARITDAARRSTAWRPLLPETKLGADARHFFAIERARRRRRRTCACNIFPDGGVSRLRVWGAARWLSRTPCSTRCRDDEARAALAALLRRRALGRGACWRGARSPSTAALHADAEAGLGQPRARRLSSRRSPTTREIGGDAATSCARRFAGTRRLVAAQEQARRRRRRRRDACAALRDGNVAYRRRFGYIFIVCATGKSAGEMLALLRGAPGQRRPSASWRSPPASRPRSPRLRLEKLARMSRHHHARARHRARPARARPGASRLDVLDGGGLARARRAAVTDADGRVRRSAAAGATLAAGTYRLTFETGAYFAASRARRRSIRASR